MREVSFQSGGGTALLQEEIRVPARPERISPDSDHSPSNMTSRAGPSGTPLDTLISENRPLATQRCQEILTRIVDSYCNQDLTRLPKHIRETTENNIQILKRAPFSVQVIESEIPNALTFTKSRSIYIHAGLLRAIQSNPKETPCWDTVAFYIAHEISHTLYNEDGRLTPEDKIDRAGAHDKENQCDRDALVLVDCAGYNVRFANFDVFGEEHNSINNRNLGLLSTHPDMYQRNGYLKEVVRSTYWRNYSEHSSHLISTDEAVEIKKAVRLGELHGSLSRPMLPSAEVTLLNCYDQIARYLSVISSQSFSSFGLSLHSRSEDQRDEFPFLKEKLEEFLSIAESGRTKSVRQKIKELVEYSTKKDLGRDPTKSEIESAEWSCFLDSLRHSQFLSELVRGRDRERYSLNRKIRDENRDETSAKYLQEEVERIKEREKSTGVRALTLHSISDQLSQSSFSAPTVRILEQVVTNLLGADVPFGESFYSWIPVPLAEIKGLLEELPPAQLLDPENLEDPSPFSKVHPSFQNEVISFATNALFRCAEDEINTYVDICKNLKANYGTAVCAGKIDQLYPKHFVVGAVEKLLKEGDEGLAEFIIQLHSPSMQRGFFADESVVKMALGSSTLFPLVPADLKAKHLSFEEIEQKTHSLTDWHSVSSLEGICREKISQSSAEEVRDAHPIICRISTSIRSHGTGLSSASLGFHYFQKIKTAESDLFKVLKEVIAVDPSLHTIGGHWLMGELSKFSDSELFELARTGLAAAPTQPLYEIGFSLKERLGLDWIEQGRFCAGLDGSLCREWSDPPDGQYIRKRDRNPDAGHHPVLLMEENLPEISNDDLVVFANISRSETAVQLIKSFFLQKLSGTPADDHLLKEVASRLDSSNSMRLSIPGDNAVLLSESIGKRVSQQDLAYIYYLNRQGIERFRAMPTAEFCDWVAEYWPKEGSLRDVFVDKCIGDRFESVSELSLQKRVLALYKDSERALDLTLECYASHKQEFLSFSERLGLIESLFPEASPQRDDLVEELLSEIDFSIPEFEQAAHYLSSFSRSYQRKDSIARGTAGALLGSLEAPSRREVMLWLLGRDEGLSTREESRKKESNENDDSKDLERLGTYITKFGNILQSSKKVLVDLPPGSSPFLQSTPLSMNERMPQVLIRREEDLSLHLTELKLSMKSAHARAEIVQELFAGNSGLFASKNRVELDRFLDELLAPAFKIQPGDSPEQQKLKLFGIRAVKSIFHIDNNPKLLRVMNSIIETLADEEVLSAERVIAAALRSYGAVGVKFGQILGSQREIEQRYPELARAISDLKDDTNPMPYVEAMSAVVANKVLLNSDIVVRERRGSASIKGAFRVSLFEEERILKVRRVEAPKELEQEQKDFEQIMGELRPLLRESFQIEWIPNYSQRIFDALREEIDFRNETTNSKRIGENAAKHSSVHLSYQTPRIDEALGDENTIIEDIAPGVPLEQFVQDASAGERRIIDAGLQKLLLREFFEDRFFHADLHRGNVFIKREGAGFRVTLIDTGLCGEVGSDGQAKFLKDLVSASLMPLQRPGRYQNVFRNFLSAQDYERYSEQLSDLSVALCKTPRGDRATTALNGLHLLPGYNPPAEVVRMLIASSKAPFLYSFHLSNLGEYWRAFRN